MANLRPRVDFKIDSALNLVSPAGAGTIAMIGTTQWGPINEVVTVNSLQQALGIFKDDKSDDSLTMIKGLSLAYANGAGTIKCIRIEDGDADYSTLTLVAGSTSVITLSGKYKGTYGDNIQVTVSAIDSNRGIEISDGVSREVYNNGGDGYEENEAIVSVINNKSNLVTATTVSNTYLVDISSAAYLSGGDDGEDGLTSTDYTDAITNYLTTEEFNILLTPGVTTNSWHNTIVGMLNTREANEDKFSVYFAGPAVDETISTMKARTASGRRFSLIAPSVVNLNRISGDEEILDGSYLACAYAGLTAQGWPELSATHKTLNVNGIIVNTTSGKKYYNNGEVEQLLENRIVPVTLISGAIQPSRAVTRNVSTTEVWYEQNIIDIVDYVRKQVLDLSNSYIGRPNLDRIRDVLAKNTDGILEINKRDEIINDYLPTEVSEGISPDTVNITLTLKPTFLINFITVTLSVSNVSA